MLTSLVLLILGVPGPDKIVNLPPTDLDVIRALPDAANVPFLIEQFHEDITLVKKQIREPKAIGPRAFYPLVGLAWYATDSWECSAYWVETTRVLGLEAKCSRSYVVYIDTDMLVVAKGATVQAVSKVTN